MVRGQVMTKLSLKALMIERRRIRGGKVWRVQYRVGETLLEKPRVIKLNLLLYS
jgi:hypothetical protein